MKFEQLTKEEIRKILTRHYNKHSGCKMENRELIECTEKDIGCIFLALSGTPPKGYGIFIQETKKLHLYDVSGKEFKKYSLPKGII